MDQPPRVQTSLRLPRELWRAVKLRAVAEGIDLQDLVAGALKQYLEKTPPAGVQEALGEYLAHRPRPTSSRRSQKQGARPPHGHHRLGHGTKGE